MNIEKGTTAQVSETVDTHSIAAYVGSGSLPVFSTPSMIALMERAACACLDSLLESGQTSVGTHADIEHLAASPMGASVHATATVVEVDGRKIVFVVEAFEGDTLIGKGRHTRVVVNAERFMSKL